MICFFQCYGQSTYGKYKREQSNLSKSKIALDLCSYYLRFHLDSLSVLGLDLLRENKKRPNPFCKAVCDRILGCYDVRSGSISNGLRLLNDSKSTFLNTGDEKLISEAYNEIGIAYLIQGDHESAEMYFQMSLSHGRRSSKSEMTYMAEINLAKSSLVSGNTYTAKMLAEHYIRQALDDQKYEAIANAYSFLGQIALDEDQMRRAQNCFKKQWKYASLTHSPFIRSRALNNQAIVHFMNDQYEKALNLFQKTLKERKNQGFHFYTCESYMNLAHFYFETDQKSTAQLYIDSCIFLAKQHNLILSHIEALELILEHHESAEVKNKLDVLKRNREELIKLNMSQRGLISSNKEKTASKSYKYIYLFIFFIAGVIWWLYSKD